MIARLFASIQEGKLCFKTCLKHLQKQLYLFQSLKLDICVFLWDKICTIPPVELYCRRIACVCYVAWCSSVGM